VINTHQHFDHSGGLRTYVTEGATIITHPINKPYYDQTFKMKPRSPRTGYPRLQASLYLPVADKYVLTDGTQKIELYPMKTIITTTGC